jgi:hypothetical protein
MVLLVVSASPAAALTSGSIPSCGSRPATLAWQVIRDGRIRAVDLAFRRGQQGPPMKPVRVTVSRGGARRLEWTRINGEQFVYRRRGRETVEFTATYVENRSRYGKLTAPTTVLPGIPGIPGIPPLPTVPPLPIPGVPPLPGVPGLPGGSAGGGGAFQADLCTRVLTRRVR